MPSLRAYFKACVPVENFTNYMIRNPDLDRAMLLKKKTNPASLSLPNYS